ncbi:hypothetical protein GQ53DRAFT_589985, partial [Thozetella sp. PMI_491]
IIQSSFDNETLASQNIEASKNGLVWAVISAYSKHHHLVIRPDDVWFSILVQISFYINKNAEELRSSFVAHEGKKHLTVYRNGSMSSVDFGGMAKEFAAIIDMNVVDKTLLPWIIPDFTTTTPSDIVTASILMMGAMQKYFSYGCILGCGIPSVTLLGEREDWVKIQNRLDKLLELGPEAALFAQILRPIIGHFVLGFDNPTHEALPKFWQRCASISSGSGSSTVTGWITGLCFWNEKGECYFPPESDIAETLYSLGADMGAIPAGYASVPLEIIEGQDTVKARMLAGSVAIQTLTSHQLNAGSNDSDALPDTLQPASGWWVYIEKE